MSLTLSNFLFDYFRFVLRSFNNLAPDSLWNDGTHRRAACWPACRRVQLDGLLASGKYVRMPALVLWPKCPSRGRPWCRNPARPQGPSGSCGSFYPRPCLWNHAWRCSRHYCCKYSARVRSVGVWCGRSRWRGALARRWTWRGLCKSPRPLHEGAPLEVYYPDALEVQQVRTVGVEVEVAVSIVRANVWRLCIKYPYMQCDRAMATSD